MVTLFAIGKIISLSFLEEPHLQQPQALERKWACSKNKKTSSMVFSSLESTMMKIVNFFLYQMFIFLAQVSFSVERIGEDDQDYWNTRHMAQIYQDNLYVLGGNRVVGSENFEVWKCDLSIIKI